MSIWILLASAEDAAQAVRLESQGVYAAPPGGQGIDVHIEPRRCDTLALSATEMATLAYRLITREGLSRSQLYLRYTLESGTIQAKGRSADLAFLLAHLTSVLQAINPDRQFPSFAATGMVDEEGRVLAVESVPAKVRAARTALADEPGALVLVPRGNWQELDEKLDSPGPEVLPVDTVYDALELLGIAFNRSWLGCPFRGLEHFGFEHRALFFGREAEVQEGMARINQRASADRPGLLVIGPSGSGKSSFLQAGVLAGLLAPTLEQGRASPAFNRALKDNLWRPAQASVPTEAALVHSLLNSWASVLPGLDAGRPEHLDQLAPFLIRHIHPGQPMLWVIDQMEELFTTHAYPADLLERFGVLLLALQQAGVWVLATLRDDYLASLMRIDSLRQWQSAVDGPYYLKPLADAEGLNAAITRPAAMAGLEFETSAQGYGLDQRLQEDAMGAADPLPLVEYALLQLYQQREGRLLTWDSYTRMGGLTGAVGQQAEAVYASFPLEQIADKDDPARRQGALRRLLRALANSGEGGRVTAQVVPLARFAQDADALSLIDALVRERLLVKFETDQVLSLRVAHEALLSQWPTAQNILEQDKGDLQRLHRLETAHARWQQAGQTLDLLLPPGLPLGEATDLRARWGADLDQPLHAYIAHSSRKARRGVLIRNAFIAVLTMLVFVAAGGIWWADTQTNEAKKQARLAEQKTVEAKKKTGELVHTNLELEKQTGVANEQTRTAQEATQRATEEMKRSTVLGLVGQVAVESQTQPGRGENAMRVLIARKLSDSPQALLALQTQESLSRNLWISLPLRGHEQLVTSVAFSPDGKFIVSGSDDKTLRRWDARTGQLIGQPMRGHQKSIASVAVSPDGRRIVSGGFDNTLRLWDAQTGKTLGQPMRGHENIVRSVAFSPDGKRIVSGGFDNTLRLWDAQTGRPIGQPMQGHESWVNCVAFSPDSKRIVSGSHDNTLRLWDAETGQPIGKPMNKPKGTGLFDSLLSITSVAFSPDGEHIVSGHSSGSLRLWWLETRTSIKQIKAHEYEVTSVAFSPDGKFLVSSSMDHTLRLSNAQTFQLIGQPMRGHDNQIYSVAFSPDGKRIVSGGADKTLRIWDSPAEPPIGEPIRGSEIALSRVALSPDGKHIALAHEITNIKLWDVQINKPIGESTKGHEDFISSIAFSPDGKRIVTGSDDKTLRLWNAQSGQPIGQPLRGHEDKVNSVAYSPNGKRIVSGSDDNTLRLWAAQTGQPIGQPLKGHDDKVNIVAFSPDGKRIASASDDETLRLWNAQTGQPIGQPLRESDTQLYSVAFSPDGKRIVSNNGNALRLRDAKTGQPIGQLLHGHLDSVSSITFSPDGKYILSGSDDKTLRLWDAQTGHPIGKPLQGHTGDVATVAFSSDGKHVVSGGHDSTFRIWPILDGWADALCARLTRNPTHAEWREWIGSAIPYMAVCPSLPVPKE